MRVRDIMSPDPETLPPTLSVRDLAERLIDHRFGGFPVVDEGKLVGMVTRSDLVRVLDLEHSIDDQLGEAVTVTTGGREDSPARRGARIGARLESMTVGDLMIRGVLSVPSDAPVAEAARIMVERRVHRLAVVDGGRLVGIVTSLDLVRLVIDERGA